MLPASLMSDKKREFLTKNGAITLISINFEIPFYCVPRLFLTNTFVIKINPILRHASGGFVVQR